MSSEITPAEDLGSYGASTGAKIATIRITTSIMSPTTARRFLMKVFQKPKKGEEGTAGLSSAVWTAMNLFRLHPRIKVGVRQVGDQVGNHHADSDQQENPL